MRRRRRATAAVGAAFLWRVVSAVPPEWGAPLQVWKLGLVAWILGAAILLATSVIGYLGWRRDQDFYRLSTGGLAEGSVLAADLDPIPGVSSDTLAERIRKGSDVEVRLARDYTDAAYESRGLIREGDLFLTIGAGDVYKVGEILLAEGESAPAEAGTR